MMASFGSVIVFGILFVLFPQLRQVSGQTVQPQMEEARLKQAKKIVAAPVCPYGNPLIIKTCKLDSHCPCGYECNTRAYRCCPSDPEDICDNGDLWEGKCGPRNYPCPCGQQCRNHPAKGYAVCCPEDDCPHTTPSCKYGNPLLQDCKTSHCPGWYECIEDPFSRKSWCCAKYKCVIGQPLAGVICGGVVGAPCPSGFSCIYPTGSSAGYCCTIPRKG